jgi:hypothetical protein
MPDTVKMKYVTFRCTEDEYTALTNAVPNDMSISQIVRRLVNAYIRYSVKHKPTDPAAEMSGREVAHGQGNQLL